MGPNRRAQERERAAARAAEEAKRAEAERRAAAEAHKIVEIWNARQAGGRALWFYPTVGAAIVAGFPWLTFSYPGCRMVRSVDLRTLERRPGASISSRIPSFLGSAPARTRRGHCVADDRRGRGRVVLSVGRFAHLVKIISVRVGLDRIGRKFDRGMQVTEARGYQQPACGAEIAIVGNQAGVPTNHNKSAWLNNRCERLDRRFGTRRIVNSISEHAVHDRGIEKLRCNPPIDLAHVADDVFVCRPPSYCGRIDVNGPKRQSEARAGPRNPAVIPLDSNK